MHKLAKAGIAGVIGTSLLLGGAGSFALWNTSADITPGTITAGTLSLTANSDGIWTDSSGNPITPSTFRMVPGDVLTYTQSLKVVAIGDHLHATLAFTAPNATNGLAAFVNVSPLTVSSTGTNVVSNGSTITVSSAASPTNVVATMSVTLPTTVTGTQGQNTQLDLSSAAFTLTQTS